MLLISDQSQMMTLSRAQRDCLAEMRRRGLFPTSGTEEQYEDARPYPLHEYQEMTLAATEPIVCVCAGWQSGKTVTLPEWLKREIKSRGPGDYGAFSSTYKLLDTKFLPELLKTFDGLADFQESKQKFVFTEIGNKRIHGAGWNGRPTVIRLGHSQNPDSLESSTLKGVAWDECGQRLIPKQSYDTVRSRLMANRGRMILASRPYEMGWFEKLVTGDDPDVRVINFPSWANPINPAKDDPYWDKIRAEMPAWRFIMQYEGRFTMPAGLIYDCFNYEEDTCNDFDVSNLNIYPG